MSRPVEATKVDLATVIKGALPGMAISGPTGDYKTDLALSIAEEVKQHFLVLRNARRK